MEQRRRRHPARPLALLLALSLATLLVLSPLAGAQEDATADASTSNYEYSQQDSAEAKQEAGEDPTAARAAESAFPGSESQPVNGKFKFNRAEQEDGEPGVGDPNAQAAEGMAGTATQGVPGEGVPGEVAPGQEGAEGTEGVAGEGVPGETTEGTEAETEGTGEGTQGLPEGTQGLPAGMTTGAPALSPSAGGGEDGAAGQGKMSGTEGEGIGEGAGEGEGVGEGEGEGQGESFPADEAGGAYPPVPAPPGSYNRYNFSRGWQNVKHGDVGPETIIGAAIGAVVGMSFCVCFVCVCYIRQRNIARAQYGAPQGGGQIEL